MKKRLWVVVVMMPGWRNHLGERESRASAEAGDGNALGLVEKLSSSMMESSTQEVLEQQEDPVHSSFASPLEVCKNFLLFLPWFGRTTLHHQCSVVPLPWVSMKSLLKVDWWEQWRYEIFSRSKASSISCISVSFPSACIVVVHTFVC